MSVNNIFLTEMALFFLCHFYYSIFHFSFVSHIFYFVIFYYLIMASLFDKDISFELGMCFAVDVLTKCIEKEIYGFISQKCENFNVQFVFLGLKHSFVCAKRKADEEICGVSKKIRNLSFENLSLDTTEDNPLEMLDEKVEPKKKIKRIKLEGDLNLACSSRGCYENYPDFKVNNLDEQSPSKKARME